jgi:hypothetical protein
VLAESGSARSTGRMRDNAKSLGRSSVAGGDLCTRRRITGVHTAPDLLVETGSFDPGNRYEAGQGFGEHA